MDFLSFVPVFVVLLVAYFCGIASILLYQWFERRSTSIQEEADNEVDYTLTVIESPHYDEGA